MAITLSLIKELKSSLNTSTCDLTMNITSLKFNRRKNKRETMYPYSDLSDIEVINQEPTSIDIDMYFTSLADIDSFRQFVGYPKSLNNYYFRYRGDRVLRVSDVELRGESMRGGDENRYFVSADLTCGDPFMYSYANVSGATHFSNYSGNLNISHGGNKEGYFDRLRIYGRTVNGSHTQSVRLLNKNDSNVHNPCFCNTLLTNAYMEYRHEDKTGYHNYSAVFTSNGSQYHDDVVNSSNTSFTGGYVQIKNLSNSFITFEMNLGYPLKAPPRLYIKGNGDAEVAIETSTTSATANFSIQEEYWITETNPKRDFTLSGLEGYKRYWLRFASRDDSNELRIYNMELNEHYDMSYVDELPLYPGNNSFIVNNSLEGSRNCSIWYCYRDAYQF